MKNLSWKLLISAGAIGLLLALAPTAQAERVDGPETEISPLSRGLLDLDVDYVAGEILVGFEPGARAADIAKARRALGATKMRRFDRIHVRHWKLPPGLSVEKAIEILQKRPGVEYAEPNYVVHTDEVLSDDERFPELWGLHNVGQTGGVADADIDAPEAWDNYGTAADDVIVAVIDTGIDYLHEELAENMWINQGELADWPDGVDNDGNGYVDDLYGWDFFNEANDPFDDRGHGTHVAGTICADGANGVGVAGVTWSCQLMALKFISAGGTGTIDGAIAAILYAADMGARVANNSWGSDDFRSRALESAIKSFDGLFVASAGNWRTSKAHFPAAFRADHILSVAATDHDDALASFSNFSTKWVDLGAPGVDILSSVPGDGGDYDLYSGTSMAAPHVSGVAALVLSQNPGFGPLDVKAAIMDGVDPLPSLDGTTVTGGRLNAYGALFGGEPPAPVDETAPAAVLDLAAAVSPDTHDTVFLNWTATADDDDDCDSGPVFAYDIRYSANGDLAVNWDGATPVEGEPAPMVACAAESMAVAGLAGGTTYEFGIGLFDEAENESGLSNIATVTTPFNPWSTTVVDDADRPGFYLSVAIDGSGEPALAYTANLGDARFAARDGDGWIITTIDSGGQGISLAFDEAGNPAAAHGSGGLHYAARSDGAWSSETLVSKYVDEYRKHLAFGPDGPCILFSMTEGRNKRMVRNLKLTCLVDNDWSIENVVPGEFAKYRDLAFDENGNPLVAFALDENDDRRNDVILLARRDGNGWAYEEVRGLGDTAEAGTNLAMAYHPATGPLLVDHANDRIRFHYKLNGAWQMVDLGVGYRADIEIDADGMPWVAMRVFDPPALKAAHPVNGSLGDWEIVTVDPTDVWWDVSIAVGNDGLPVIGYSDDTENLGELLKLAKLSPQP